MTTTQEDGAAASTSADPHGADAEPPPDACSPAQAQSPPRPGDAPGTDFAEWYAREFGRLRATLALATGDVGLAEEATAEAFARALAHAEPLRDPVAWIYRVAFRIAIDEIRREGRQGPAADDAHVPPAELIGLFDALRRLSPNQRAAVVLRHVNDLDIEEVAARMGVSRATVRVHLHRARGRLRELLGTEEDRP